MLSSLPISVVAALVWIGAAALIDISPRAFHIYGALFGLIPTMPIILIGLWLQVEWYFALVATIAALSVIRWPIYYLVNYIGAKCGFWKQWDPPKF